MGLFRQLGIPWLVFVIPLVFVSVESSFSFLKLPFVSSSEKRDLSGFKLYKVVANTKEQLVALRQLFEGQNQNSDVEFWNEPVDINDETEVMVPMNKESVLKSFFSNSAMNYSVIMDDIGKLVTQQYESMQRSRETTEMTWTEYHWPETILAWLQNLTSTGDTVVVESKTIGLTVERRPLQLVKISGTKGSNKGSVFLDAGIHAREWIAPAVGTWIVNQLVNNASSYEHLLRRYDFYMLPLLNPDGYAYTCSYNRLWRKTRKANDMLLGLIGCRGVDLNRNFGFSWGGRGSGRHSCSLTYGGPQEFSEPESAAIRDFMEDEQNTKINWRAYFSLHSFGQKWLSPWGHTSSLPDDYTELERVGKIGVEALRSVHGTRYRFGSTSNTLYTASGSSMDWMKGAVGIKYAYTLELRDYGLYGFLLPASQIIPTAEESWAGIQAALLAIPEEK